MILWKPARGNVDTAGTINFKSYFEAYSFARWAFDQKYRFIQNPGKSKTDVFIKGAKIDWKKFMADFSSSLISSLYEHQKFKRIELVEEALRCCRALLYDDGYKLADSSLVSDLCRLTEKTYVLVAGCQSEAIIDSRVRAAKSICETLLSPPTNITIKVVFSGNNPLKTGNREKITIPDESLHMKIEFTKLMPKRKSGRRLELDVVTESNSSSTIENIMLFCERERKLLEDNKTSIILVSSNFHLLRLSLLMSEKILVEPKFLVDNIILVGADEVSQPSRVAMENNYIKSMFFELFLKLYTIGEFWDYRT